MSFSPYPLVTCIGAIELSIASPEYPPAYHVEAIIEEQDTCLLLGTDMVIREPVASYETLVSDMITQHQHTPGEVIMRKGRPMRFLAIIHDLEKVHPCRLEWVETALDCILDECEKQGITNMAMPVLGTRHGAVRHEVSINLLLRKLAGRYAMCPNKIWLIVPLAECELVRNLLIFH